VQKDSSWTSLLTTYLMASTLPPTPTTSSAKRDMSYRKPVPVFVPSPPTSPGATTSEIEDELATEEEIPPVSISLRTF